MLKFYKLCICFFIGLAPTTLFAQTEITGQVIDDKGQPLPYSTIIIVGTTIGTLSNEDGKYSLKLKDGNYTLRCLYVGFQSKDEKVNIRDNKKIVVDFKLQPHQNILQDVVVGRKGEDPAYEIMRQAIKQREAHNKELKNYEVEIYGKDVIQLKDVPKSFFGKKIDSADLKDMGVDSSRQGIIYLSEYISRLAVQKPENRKLTVMHSRVSGSNGYGFAFPSVINLYQNNVQVFSNQLNPRGFISPVADGALNYYKFKLL